MESVESAGPYFKCRPLATATPGRCYYVHSHHSPDTPGQLSNVCERHNLGSASPRLGFFAPLSLVPSPGLVSEMLFIFIRKNNFGVLYWSSPCCFMMAGRIFSVLVKMQSNLPSFYEDKYSHCNKIFHSEQYLADNIYSWVIFFENQSACLKLHRMHQSSKSLWPSSRGGPEVSKTPPACKVSMILSQVMTLPKKQCFEVIEDLLVS